MEDEDRFQALEARVHGDPHFNHVMALIKPNPERTPDCKRKVFDALMRLEIARRTDQLPTPAKMRDILMDHADVLRRIEKDAVYSHGFRDQTRRERQRLEGLMRDVPPGSRQLSDAKYNAVHFAYHILLEFGGGPPGLTRQGGWHKLATYLFGDDDADLFEYMDLYKSLPKVPPFDEMLFRERIGALLPRVD
jgi:hypothetical protein